MTGRPLLKIHADQQATLRALIKMKRSIYVHAFIAFIMAVTLVYFVTNQVEPYRFLLGFLCLFSACMSWISYKTVPIYQKEHQDLPLLYSFYAHGFISHRGENEYTWEHIAKLYHSKKGITIDMSRNPHKTARLTIIYVSDEAVTRIVHHFKAHAPERLIRKIEV